MKWPKYSSWRYQSGKVPKEKWQKGQSDAVGRRMTTNTMTKRKMTKGAIW
jgi:hypothetical protein